MNMLSHWPANPVVLAVVGIVAVTHLLGLRSTLAEAKRLGRPRPAGALMQAAMFYCGLLAVLVALVSPMAYWSGKFIWVRSQQDVLLALAAPGLIVLGAPWLMLRRGAASLGLRRFAPQSLRGPDAAHLDARQDGHPGQAPANRSWLAWPIAVVVAFNACWLGWHLPGPYDAAHRHPAVLAAEVVTYLGLGIAFWLQIIGSQPVRPRLAPLLRAFLVAGSLAVTSVLGMVLVFSHGVLYPAYLGPAHHLLGVVSDQNIGGAVLWTGALVPFGIAAIALCIRWLGADESEALGAGLDRLLRPSASAWPSRPGFK
jgi:putative membrane protein